MPARIFSLRFSIFYAFMAIGAGIQLPFLPLWLHARGLTVGEIAIVVAGMTAIRILAVPLAAFVSDRYQNRRSVIIVCGFAAFAAFLMLAFATSFWLIFSFSLLASFCWAPVFPLAESFSVDGSAAHRIDYGRMRLWASLSFLTGSLGGGILLQLLSINSVIFLMAGAGECRRLWAYCCQMIPKLMRKCWETRVQPTFPVLSGFWWRVPLPCSSPQ
jgi:PPP family 3-phenylpropionic acid transporter